MLKWIKSIFKGLGKTKRRRIDAQNKAIGREYTTTKDLQRFNKLK